MSNYLWKAYYEDDLDTFQWLLEASVAYTRPHASRGGSIGPVIGSPGQSVSTPIALPKSRKSATPSSGGQSVTLTKSDINSRDATGQTLLHHAVSSTAEDAAGFVSALIAHPLIDLYIQDYESGWTPLHRAFYFGNVTFARLMLERDAGDAFGRIRGHAHPTIGLVKVKDREGYGPLDLYAATIKDRTLRPDAAGRSRSGSSDSDEDRATGLNADEEGKVHIPFVNIKCDQLFTFGSNKNVSLGFSNEDDRQYPERIHLRRPEHLLRRFYAEHVEQHDRKWLSHDPHYQPMNVNFDQMWADDIPWLAKMRPLIIQDVHMAKLHSAALTSDPESNLYICGHGQGGRLGTGDEQTRYNFVCIDGGALSGKKVVSVALGLNHTLALSEDGEIFSWGSNGQGQLGYSLPKTTSTDEDPISTVPRQIFGPLKRELVVGVAASRIHSVAYTGASLFTFGKNEGQLGIIDSDARSLDIQVTPRKVAASLFASNIAAASAMEKTTVCLLENHEVWIFANYGYAKVQFPLEGFTNYFLQKSFRVTTYDHETNHIVKLTCGGDTVCALSSRGEIYTLSIAQRQDGQATTSTTNPAKIRSAITQPQLIWSPKRISMAARDVGVDADGCIILSTEEGSVWKRTKRAKIKDATAAGTGDYKPKDYKFSRIPGLTRVLAVRASSHGAYAAVKRDCDVTKTQVVVEDQSLWKDVTQLLSLRQAASAFTSDTESDEEIRHRFWQSHKKADELQVLKRFVLESKDIEGALKDLEPKLLAEPSAKYDALLATTLSDVKVPVHRFMLTGRSRVMRRGFRDLCETSTFTIPDLAVSEIDREGRALVMFQGLDILTVIDLALYLYTDSVVDFWHYTRNAPKMAYRYRQIRTELMKVATKLELGRLEQAARQMVQPRKSLDMDLEVAYADPAFFYDGDVVIQLEDDDIRVHSALLRARCPFFEGMFMGRAGGRWLAGRDDEEAINVDLKHITAKTFTIVLRFLYTDAGSELFDEMVSVSMDDFVDSVMDVLSAANELMLDRLSQICQEVIGRFVNVRNVCGLLNAIAPSSVPEFKDAALEYLCLSLEAVLQGHHLNELDEDLLSELDEVVRANQLACMPFAKSGRAEALLHERNPHLAEAIDRSRQAKLDAISIRAKYQNMDNIIPGSFDDDIASSPSQPKARRKSSGQAKLEPGRPSFKAATPSKDTMFTMDEDLGSATRSPGPSPSIRPMSKEAQPGSDPLSPSEETWYDSRGKAISSPSLAPISMSSTPATPGRAGPPANLAQPWSLSPLPGSKADMKSIMEQAASNRVSSLSQGLASNRATGLNISAPQIQPNFKMSQKDRKRLQQSQQAVGTAAAEPLRPDPSPTPTTRPASAWQTISAQKPANIGDILVGHSPRSAVKPANVRAASTPQLTMRQTVANSKAVDQSQKPVSDGSQMAQQSRTVSESRSTATMNPQHGQSRQTRPPPNDPLTPQSIRHRPPVELPTGSSMSEIVAQQQFEKDVVKEAVAKRDLQDIQTEQEFQEWWDKESAKVQEAEKHTATSASRRANPKKHRGRGGRGPKPKGESSSKPPGQS